MNKENSKIPENLSHKPIYVIENYGSVDGHYKNDTDVVGLSVGKAQWCSDDEVIPSVKVWRKKNGKWSRQSEETTFTRAIDMAMFVIKVLDRIYNGKEFEQERSLQGELSISLKDIDLQTVKKFDDFLYNEKDDINEHINVLYSALNSYMNNMR